MTTRAFVKEEVKRVWKSVADVACAIVLDEGLEVTAVAKTVARELLYDTLDKPHNKKLIKEQWLNENKDWVKATYSRDRLMWLVDAVDIYGDIMGECPPVYLSDGQRFNWWQYYHTIRGTIPPNYPDNLSFYWALRYFARENEAKVVRAICRDFLAKHPEAEGALARCEIPEAFVEIREEIEPYQLFNYWRSNNKGEVRSEADSLFSA